MDNSIRLTTSTAGMQNYRNPEKPVAPGTPLEKNLLAQAVELARDGTLDAADLAKLKETAGLDGEMQASEALLMQSLTQDGKAFIDEVVKVTAAADFDVNGFSWSVGNKLQIESDQGQRVSMSFNPGRVTGESGKGQATSELYGAAGTGEQARKDLIINLPRTPDNQIDDATIKVWNKTDKYNLADVKSFMEAHIPKDKQAEFVSDYLKGYYAHSGEGASFSGGGDIQSLLPVLPADANHRKFIDCEGYTALTASLLGDVKAYAVDGNGAEGGNARNHQVGVVRIDDRAYVQSNGSIQEIKGGAGKTDQQLIEAYRSHDGDHPFSRPQLDGTGPLQTGSEVFSKGDKVTFRDAEGKEQKYRIQARIDDFTLAARGPDGKRYEVRINPENSQLSLHPAVTE
ncbi:MAG TPA: hypothetical protein V6D23_09985 [Candidatus Obscuribacterales bacterium]